MISKSGLSIVGKSISGENATTKAKRVSGLSSADGTIGSISNEAIVREEKKTILQNDIKRFSPFPQGALTPSNMQSAAVKKLNNNQATENLKTTIPSKSYDANYVEELRLRDVMNNAKKNYEETKANDDRNILVKFLQMGSDLSPVHYTKTQYDKAKKEYEDFKSINYYSKLPNGVAQTTNKTGINNASHLMGDTTVDWRHEYINNFNNFQSVYVGSGIGQENYSKYAFMNEREKGIYNYLYNIDISKAEEFLKFLDEDLQERLTEKNVKSAYNFASKNEATAVLGSIASIGTNLASAVEQGKNIFNYATTGEISENSATKITNALRSGVTDNVDVEIGNWDAFDFVYNTVMSGADSLVVAPMGAVGAVTLGLSAAGSTTNDILSRGGDSSQAFWGGVAAGVFEGFFEKFSIGQLNAMKEGAVTGFKDYARNLVKSMATNFSEEAATEVANILYDYAMNGGISNYSIMVQEFIDNGYTPEEAKKKAATKLGLQVLEAGASGALMGFGFASISSSASYKKTSSIGKVIAANEAESEIINAALSMDGNSQSYKLATEIQQSGKMTAAKIGGLAVQVMSDASAQKGTAIKTAVGERAQELGVDFKTTQKLTEYLTQVATNGKIETANAEDIGKNVKAQQIITEIKNSEAWTEGMNNRLSSLEKTEAVIRNAITFDTAQNSSAAVDNVSAPPLTETETQLLNTPDVELTPEQRSEKQGVEERLQTANNDVQGLGVQQTVEDGNAENSNIEMLSVRKKSKQRRHTTAKEQSFIKSIADNLGVKVEFEHITAELLRSYGYEFNDGDILPDGYYDRNTKTIHMGYTVYNPVTFILKHELTHFGEGTAQYEKFVKAVKKSRAFKNWLGKETGYRKVNNLEDAYLLKIAKVRGYAYDKNGELSVEDRAELHCEMIADFVGECIFTDNTTMLEDMLSDLSYEERKTVIEYIRDFISYIKKKLSGERDISLEISRLEDMFNRMISEAVDTKKETPTEDGGDLQFDIAVLENGNTYVKASRKVINGTTLKDQRADITNFFKRLLKNKPSIDIHTIEGDILTITMDDTADKARDNYKLVDGKPVKMSDEEFAVKLRVESHIDEIAETALKENKPLTNDEKKHDFAKDGFEYRTAYFEDFDGAYYKIRFSVGHNGTVATVYNVGKIKEDVPSSAKLIAVVGSQALDGSSSNDIILNNESFVNNNYTQESGNNSKNKLQFSFARVQDTALIEEAEQMEKQLQDMNYSPEKIRNEIWRGKGIMRDTGGIWIYEIEDRSMKFFPLGNAKKDIATNGDGSVYRKGKVEDFIKHPKLFKAFPILKSFNFEICDFEDDRLGEFDAKNYTIRISASEVLKANKKLEELGGKMPRDAYENPYKEINGIIIHEMQHALQRLENREFGSDVGYWNARFKRDGKLPIDKRTGEQHTPETAYWYTKGEYEAREAQKRVPISPKYRESIVPDLGHGKTISANEKVEKENLKFSIPTDAEYMSTVETGDTAQLHEMVDNAAMSNGYTERLYHQTGAEFTEFNTENQAAGKFDWQLPTGIFLKPSDEDIGLKGKKQMELFAKTENPLRFKNRSEAQEFWSERIPGYSKAVKEVEKIDNEYREKDNDAITELQSYMRQWKRENPDADKRDIYSHPKYQRLADKESEIMDEWELKSDKASVKAKGLINDFITQSDYDGIIIERDDDGKNRHTKSYIVFDSAQLKSAAPVTYDNDGNVIALSERFNQDKKDIRFSVPSSEVVDSYSEEQYNKWESYELTSEFIRKVPYSERSIFLRSLANKTNGMRQGERKNVVIITDEHIYFYEATGYMNGSIVKRSRFTKKANAEIKKWSDYYGSIDTSTTTPYEMAKGYEGGKRRNDWDYVASQDSHSKGRNDEMVESSSESNSIGDTWESNGDFETDAGLIPGSLVYTDNGEAYKVNEDGTIENIQFSNRDNEAGLNKPAFSMPSETAELLDMYESGEISKSEYKAAMDKYWDDMLAEMEDSVWAEKISSARRANQLKKRIRRQNEQLARRRSEISQEVTAQREERASKQKNIEHIRKTVSRIDKMLRTNSNTKHVPEELKEGIARFISVFVENDRSPFDRKDLRDIQLAYSYAMNEAAALDETNGFDEDILHAIKKLREKLEGKTLRDLDLYETLLIRNIVDNLSHIIKQANDMFIAGKSQQIHEVGHIAMQELTSKESKKANAVTNALDDTVVYSNMTPIYFFDKIGGVFKTLFGDVVEAQNKWFKNVENGKAFIRQIKEKYNYSQWADDKLEFTTENGDRIKITREQAMLLYATAKREHKNASQNSKHLFSGGVVIEPSAKKLKDIVNKFKSSSTKGRERIIEMFSEEIDARAHKITYKDMVEVGNWLTKEQVAYVNAFVEYLSTDMAALGNEVSMELYGIRKYNEDYYIPYNSAQNFLYSQPGVTNEARLKHQSFTKNTVYGANNPLILSDFSTVCADHINRMCMYNALTLPLENMNKIFNYGTSGEEISTKNIKSEIERVYGKSAVTYLKTFIEDMNGNVRASQTDKAINRWISLFKKGAVFASASVVVQQPSAIIRAMAHIKPKYFLSTTFKFSERDYQQCVKWTSVAGIKEMGRFDTGVGATTTNWLLQETPRGAKNKIKALLSKDSTYRDDKLSYFAAKADEITWAHIWAAVKAEIADTTKLEVGSKEFFETCGKRFTEVINYTQVYDSTISRSQIMRSKSTGAQMLTAFMSEPTVSLNLLMRAATEAKSGTKQGKQFAVNAVAAFVGSVVLNSLLKSLVTAARDDDEDKTYLEKYVGNFVGNFVSDIMPWNLIPFVKDIVSIFEGYTVERADMNLFSDLAQSVKTLNSDSKSEYQKFESILGSLAAFLGIPVKNMLRDGRSAYNLYKDFFVNDNKTDWQGIKSSIFDYSNSDKYEALVKAAEKDDEKEYQAIYKDLIDSGKDDSKIKSGIKKVYRESGEVQKQTKQYMKSLDENKTFTSFDDEDKQKLESDIMSSLATEKTVKAMVSKPDSFDELYEAYRNNKSNYKRLKQQMLDEGMSASLINDGLEIARISYMKSVGIDVGEYLLYKIATSKKNADTDKSGGVSKAEKSAAVREMDIDQKIKNYFLNQHK